MSFSLSLDPETDLEPGFCDPIQITDAAYNDAAIWVDFTAESPRQFRLGVFGDLDAWNPDGLSPDEHPGFLDRLEIVDEPPFDSGRWTHVVITYSGLNQAGGVANLYLDDEHRSRAGCMATRRAHLFPRGFLKSEAAMATNIRINVYAPLVVTALMLPAVPMAYGQDRMPPISVDDMTAEQRSVAEKFEADRGTAILRGPWVPLLRSPEVLSLMLDMRSHVRDRSLLSPKLTELAILLAAREWTQQYEWSAHAGAAAHAGLKPAIIEAVADGRRPVEMTADEERLYDLSMSSTATRASAMRPTTVHWRRSGKRGSSKRSPSKAITPCWRW